MPTSFFLFYFTTTYLFLLVTFHRVSECLGFSQTLSQECHVLFMHYGSGQGSSWACMIYSPRPSRHQTGGDLRLALSRTHGACLAQGSLITGQPKCKGHLSRVHSYTGPVVPNGVLLASGLFLILGACSGLPDTELVVISDSLSPHPPGSVRLLIIQMFQVRTQPLPSLPPTDAHVTPQPHLHHLWLQGSQHIIMLTQDSLKFILLLFWSPKC